MKKGSVSLALEIKQGKEEGIQKGTEEGEGRIEGETDLFSIQITDLQLVFFPHLPPSAQ